MGNDRLSCRLSARVDLETWHILSDALMIKPEQLRAKLAPVGFELAWHDAPTMEICLVRPDGIRGLWQRVRIHSGTTMAGNYSGRRGDAVGPIRFGISAIRGRGTERLQEQRIVDDPTVFTNAREVESWERDFAARVPAVLEELSAEAGPRLDAATRAYRHSVDGYETLLRFGTTITELENWLEAKAVPAQIAAADRLGSGAAYVPGGVSLYRLAALALIVLRPEVEPSEADFASIRAADDVPDFKARLELLVDRLLLPGRPGGPIEPI